MPITIQQNTDLDVTCKYKELVKEAMGPDGPYIKLKETIQEMFENDSFQSDERDKVVAQALSAVTTSVATGAMSTALAWEQSEVNLALEKEKLEYSLELLAKQIENADNQTQDTLASTQLKQAQRIREYGTAQIDSNGNVVSLSNDGKIYKEELGVAADNLNKAQQLELLQAQEKTAQANTHKVIADTYVNYGMFSGYTIAESGITGASPILTGYTTLSDTQKAVAAEQVKGYAYNAWSNSATSTSSMIGVLLGSENAGALATEDVVRWRTIMDKLSTITPTSI